MKRNREPRFVTERLLHEFAKTIECLLIALPASTQAVPNSVLVVALTGDTTPAPIKDVAHAMLRGRACLHFYDQWQQIKACERAARANIRRHPHNHNT